MDDWFGRLFPWVLVAGVVGCIAMAIHNESEWRQFKVTHQCIKVGHMSGDVFPTYGVSASGNMTVGVGTTPDKTGWKCNDGITYWR